MNVVVVTNILTPYRVPLFEALAKQCERFTVLLMAEREENRQWVFGKLPFRTEVLPGWHVRPKGAEVSLHFNYGVVRRLRRLNPDIVLSGGFAPAHLAAFAFCNLFGKRYVQWGEFTLRDGAQSSFIRRYLRRLTVGGSAACIASSNEARDAFRFYGAGDRPILTAPMPIEIERMHRAVRALRGGGEVAGDCDLFPGQILLSVGRLTDAKGTGALLSMYDVVRRVRPDVALMLVGDGPDRGKYESLCRERGWNRVHFAGHVDPMELPRYFALADVFVFPTFSDTFGAVLSEAMAAELPVVASVHAAATHDLVEEGVTGFRFDPRNLDSGAEAILNALALSDRERVEMGHAAYRRVRSTDIGPSAQVIGRFLRSLLSDPTGEQARSQFTPSVGRETP
ncbi:MAG: glycosyltransferase family 4 protein [Nitrospira sp.]|nr:MAG: glycosyltransferase family 4 protein [Nitrospira sp. CG24D]